MQATQEKATTVRLETNEKNLFRNLGVVFTDKTKVLSELIQNSRRAGATEIHFVMKDDILTIADNGKGIDNFQKLLTCADSGWNEETMQSENPFGMGWLSTLYAADQVVVESRGQRCRIDTKSVLEMKEVEIEPCIDYGKTVITLIGVQLTSGQTHNALHKICRGFPTPVFLNGVEIDRPHALCNLPNAIESNIGTINLCKSHDATRSFVLYCQGLPVTVPSKMEHHLGSLKNILHLDNKFKVRMPDRDSLINEEDVANECQAELDVLWRKELTNLKTTQSSTDFAAHYPAMKSFKCLDLLNDIDVLPRNIVKQVVDYPSEILCMGDDFLDNSKFEVTKDLVESGKVFVISNLDKCVYGNDGNAYAIMTAIKDLKDWVVLAKDLDPDHWIYKHVIDADKTEFKVLRTPIKKGEISGNFVDARIEIVEPYEIRFGCHTFKDLKEPIAFGNGTDDGAVIILPESSANDTDVLGQVSSFERDYGYDENAFEEDCDEFHRVVDIMSGQPSNVTIEKELRDSSITSRENCVDTANVVLVGSKHSYPKCVSLESVLAEFISQNEIQCDAQAIKSFVVGLLAKSGS